MYLVWIAFLLLAGCTQQSKPLTIKIEDTKIPFYVPLYVGIEKGFFQKQGINLKIVKQEEEADWSIVPPYREAEGEMMGSYLKYPVRNVVFLKSSPINKLSDLNGCVIGYLAEGQGAKKALKEQGVLLAEVVQIPFNHQGAYLQSRKVDALVGPCLLMDNGLYRQLSLETSENYEWRLIAHNKAWMGKPFEKALKESTLYAKAHPEEAFEIYAKMENHSKYIEQQKQLWIQLNGLVK